MGPSKLYDKLNGDGFPIEFDEAAKLYRRYCEEFKTGVKFLRESGKKAASQGYLANLSGRRRYWNKPNADDVGKYPRGRDDPEYLKRMGGIEREGGNFLIQAVNADITKLAMNRIRRYCKQNGIRSHIMLQVYDEIVTCTHKEDSEEFRKVKIKIMEDAAYEFISSVPVEVDGNVLPYWTK